MSALLSSMFRWQTSWRRCWRGRSRQRRRQHQARVLASSRTSHGLPRSRATDTSRRPGGTSSSEETSPQPGVAAVAARRPLAPRVIQRRQMISAGRWQQLPGPAPAAAITFGLPASASGPSVSGGLFGRESAGGSRSQVPASGGPAVVRPPGLREQNQPRKSEESRNWRGWRCLRHPQEPVAPSAPVLGSGITGGDPHRGPFAGIFPRVARVTVTGDGGRQLGGCRTQASGRRQVTADQLQNM